MNQLPFSSLNYGLDTSIEGRMATESLLDASIKGIGSKYRTSIFPCGIFQLKDGVNNNRYDPNYDLKRKALFSTVKRFYPNYFNCDWSVQVNGIKKDRELKRNVINNLPYEMKKKLIEIFKVHPEYAEKINLFVDKNEVLSVSDKVQPTEEGGTMGCLDGEEVVTYKLNGNLYVESFERFWRRVCMETNFEVKRQSKKNLNLYIDLENVQIYDSGKNDFVECKRIIRNIQKDWNKVYLSSGRVLDCTDDHPLPTERGRVYARDLILNSDKLTIVNKQYTEYKHKLKDDIAWLCGVSIYDDEYKKDSIWKKVISNVLFDGHDKKHIPTVIFTSDKETKLNFLAGMINAVGNVVKENIIRLESDNKELSIQQMLLANSLNMKANFEEIHYDYSDYDKIYYRVEFIPSSELVSKFKTRITKLNYNGVNADEEEYDDLEKVYVTKIEPYTDESKYSYDVTTEFDHFDVSGIWSHNCRTYNGFDSNFDEEYFMSLLNEIIKTNKLPRNYLFSAMQKDGRGNIAPYTVIMPTLAMEARVESEKTNEDIIKIFMDKLDENICDAKNFLIERFEHICSQKPESAKFMYDNDIMKGYIRKEGIRSALKHGTLAIGQLGLAETLEILIGCNHLNKSGMKLAKRIEQLFKDRCDQFKEQYKLNFGVYYTPAENLCYTAMKKFKKQFGDHPYVKTLIENKKIRDYFTNSIHVPVWEKIDPFTKIDIESQLTGYSNAGCITYVELDGKIIDNIDAVEQILQYAKEKDCPYIAFNIPADCCLDCGFIGDFSEKYECIHCGSKNILMPARVTGYLTGDYRISFNKGKQKEKEDRVKHSKYFPGMNSSCNCTCGCGDE